jgi:tubulin beta
MVSVSSRGVRRVRSWRPCWTTGRATTSSSAHALGAFVRSSMREIISVHVGGAGNKIGARFFAELCAEHGVTPSGRVSSRDDAFGFASTSEGAGAGAGERVEGAGARQRHRGAFPDVLDDPHAAASRVADRALEVYFHAGKRGRVVPRAVLCDLDPRAVDGVRASPLGGLFRPDAVVVDRGDATTGGNWAAGYHRGGANLVDRVMDAVRREAEEADAVQGFSLVHALGGGAGSGLGTLLLERLCDEYADRMIVSFPVFPSVAASDAVLETFNAAMCVPRLADRCDVVFLSDNGALRRACDRDANRRHERTTLLRLAVPPPEASMDDLNRALATAMAGATATFRFPGRLNASLRKLAVNLAPFPRVHFASPSHAPLLAVDEYVPGTVRHLVKEAFAPHSRVADVDPANGVTLTATAVFRGVDVPATHAEREIRRRRDASRRSVAWIPDNVQCAVCDAPPVSPVGADASCTVLTNTTAVRGVFRRLAAHAAAMVSRGAFVHWYRAEGMEDEQLEEALGTLAELDAEYQQYEGVDVGGEAAWGADDVEDAEDAEDASAEDGDEISPGGASGYEEDREDKEGRESAAASA